MSLLRFAGSQEKNTALDIKYLSQPSLIFHIFTAFQALFFCEKLKKHQFSYMFFALYTFFFCFPVCLMVSIYRFQSEYRQTCKIVGVVLPGFVWGYFSYRKLSCQKSIGIRYSLATLYNEEQSCMIWPQMRSQYFYTKKVGENFLKNRNKYAHFQCKYA